MDMNLTETKVDGELVYQGGFLRVQRDRVALPDGKITAREFVLHPGAVVILPLMLKHLSANEYRDVAAMGKDSFVAAAMNSLVASVVFVLAWVATIPLWLIPGFSLLIPLLLMGWLNRRTFAFDALSMHASDSEWQAIRSGQKTPLFMLGLTMALLAHIPVVGLLVPALAALSFVHYGLEALRRSRGGALVTIEGERL